MACDKLKRKRGRVSELNRLIEEHTEKEREERRRRNDELTERLKEWCSDSKTEVGLDAIAMSRQGYF